MGVFNEKRCKNVHFSKVAIDFLQKVILRHNALKCVYCWKRWLHKFYTFEDLKWDNCPFRIFRYCPFEIFGGVNEKRLNQ